MYDDLINVATVLVFGNLQRLLIYCFDSWSANAWQVVAAMGLQQSNA